MTLVTFIIQVPKFGAFQKKIGAQRRAKLGAQWFPPFLNKLLTTVGKIGTVEFM